MPLDNVLEYASRPGKEEYRNKAKTLLDGRRYFIVTYGCHMNVHDSEKIAGMLESIGIHPFDYLRAHQQYKSRTRDT